MSTRIEQMKKARQEAMPKIADSPGWHDSAARDDCSSSSQRSSVHMPVLKNANIAAPAQVESTIVTRRTAIHNVLDSQEHGLMANNQAATVPRTPEMPVIYAMNLELFHDTSVEMKLSSKLVL
mmetsp:Transcript_30181/g.71828  ORF Transcript_30181/g.71828 Transcript_30181/m.71828 type:complete len:123 (+) Transcript_30181:61-429(+)